MYFVDSPKNMSHVSCSDWLLCQSSFTFSSPHWRIRMENGQRLCNMCNVIGMVNRDLWDWMNSWIINLGEIFSNKNIISFTWMCVSFYLRNKTIWVWKSEKVWQVLLNNNRTRRQKGSSITMFYCTTRKPGTCQKWCAKLSLQEFYAMIYSFQHLWLRLGTVNWIQASWVLLRRNK